MYFDLLVLSVAPKRAAIKGVNLISFQMVVVTFSTEHFFYMKIHDEVWIEQSFHMLLFSFKKPLVLDQENVETLHFT